MKVNEYGPIFTFRNGKGKPKPSVHGTRGNRIYKNSFNENIFHYGAQSGKIYKSKII